MVKIAFIFPGQGSQSVGMGIDLYKNFNCAKEIFDRANTILNKNIKQLCFEDSEEALNQTINTQPCIVTNSIAILETLKSQSPDIEPYCVAGHSLGEYSAMYSANVLDFEQTLLAIQKRAELMASVQEGGMMAVLKATQEQINEALTEGTKAGYIDVANYNSEKQIVLTGDKEALMSASEKLLSYGGIRCVPLAVSGAFHSKYMKKISKEFDGYISNLKVNEAKIPVITNVDAEPTVKASDFKKKMPAQLYSSVQWLKTMKKMWTDGVDTFIEIGNGQVLTGLCKRILPEAKVYSVHDKKSLEETLTQL